GWMSPLAQRPKEAGPWGGQVGGAFSAAAFYLWLDTFEANSLTNQLETYALFRSAAPLLPPLAELPQDEAPLTTYFRTTFPVESAAQISTLRVDGHVDSGAVVYLNGVEVARVAMPQGVVTADVLATGDGPHPVVVTDLPVDWLIDGDNVLAVEVHQSGPDDVSLVMDLELTATVASVPLAQPSDLVLSEISAGGQTPAWVELVHRGSAPLILAGHTLGRADGIRRALPVDSLAPGERLLVRGDALDFTLEAGHLLALWGPEGQVLDGVRVLDVVRARPEGQDPWRYPEQATPGEPNTFESPAGVVVSEVLYHAPPVGLEDGSILPDPTEWIELQNLGEQPLDLGGWRLVEGVVHVFGDDAVLPAGGRLVVSADGARPPGTPEAVSVLGPWVGRLSNGGDAVTLLDRCGNPVDRVDYRDGGRWPSAADGWGSSLERRHPGGPSASPETWGEQTDVNESADWFHAKFLAVMGANLNMTRTPDVHFA
ncbi:MAG: lamin tail domain-containing protein, partial [Myxococcota bacterium]|nr:lamin tail domain-containing protein [Myxococcota bacterium]